MNFTKKFFLFFIITLPLYANNFQNIKTLETDFIQTIQNPSGTKVYYEGKLYIKEPNLIKWEYKKPFQKYVYIKKYTITIIEPELEQAIMTKTDKEINILALLKKAKKISQNLYTSRFNNIDFNLTLHNNRLKNISYKDELENSVLIEFTQVQQNHNIEDKIFKFRIPNHYDLIKK
ncbi:LolA-like outer membrane lipoprotein chaperone [Arcobacter sp. 15-2]|uniref:LolA-like outer membrane lipoprotein chaperone n=1 Tax=Arcobacter sp. 15-2 TaxID=3374109 RepID=UPI00399CA15A